MKKQGILILFLFVFSISIYSAFSLAAPRKIILEYCTSTNCSYCPCADSIADHIIAPAFPQTVIVAYHGLITDPYYNDSNETLRNNLGLFIYPSGNIDRRFSMPHSRELWLDDFNQRMNESPSSPVDITIESQGYSPNTRQFSINLNFKANSELAGEYRVQVLLTENNLVSSQTGNPGAGCYGGENYVHYHVLRTILGTTRGMRINPDSIWNNNVVYTKSFTTTINSGFIANNMDFAIVVFKCGENGMGQSEVQQAEKGTVTGVIGIREENLTPFAYRLWQNYPNPFNPVTNIKFSVPKNDFVKIEIFNMLGVLIAEPVSRKMGAGVYNLEFSATGLASGVYYYRMTSGSYAETKKMIVIK